MAEAAAYRKGTWKAEVSVEELPNGKYQGVVSFFREGMTSTEQIERRTIDQSDTFNGALAEAKMLAQHQLGNL